MKIGFNKARRVMNELEERGCIGPPMGPGVNREILRNTLGESDGFDDEE